MTNPNPLSLFTLEKQGGKWVCSILLISLFCSPLEQGGPSVKWKISFLNLPSRCLIGIYTMPMELGHALRARHMQSLLGCFTVSNRLRRLIGSISAISVFWKIISVFHV